MAGYKLIESDHPKSINGMYYEHIINIEKNIGRELLGWETVHHINEIKDDNRIENLFVCSRQEHDKAHGMKTVSMYKLHPNWIRKTCKYCKKDFYGAPSIIKKRVKCSATCKSLRVDKLCDQCGSIYTVPVTRSHLWDYCSKQCRRKAKNDKRS
jgi:hypothetical protein